MRICLRQPEKKGDSSLPEGSFSAKVRMALERSMLMQSRRKKETKVENRSPNLKP